MLQSAQLSVPALLLPMITPLQHASAVLTAKGRIAAATYPIMLIISTLYARYSQYGILQWVRQKMPPPQKKLPLPVGSGST